MIQVIEIKSLAEYFHKLEEIHNKWGIHHADSWYRGIASINYELLPGVIWRNIKNGNKLTEDFLIHYMAYSEKEIKNKWELYTIMQHYGLPTRLLDWTKKPLVALYFALEEDSKTRPKYKNERAVWIISPHELNNITQKDPDVPCSLTENTVDTYLPEAILRESNKILPLKPLAITVPLSNKRVISQEGVFTVHGSEKKSIDTYFSESNNDKIVKFIIKEDFRNKLQTQLFALGYKEDDIYQDLNSLSKRIVREWGC